MNVDTNWMMEVFEKRQIKIVGWMGKSIFADQLELILNDARREELALKKSIEYTARLYMTRGSGALAAEIGAEYKDILPEALQPRRFNETKEMVIEDMRHLPWHGDGWYRLRAELTDRWRIVSMTKEGDHES